MPLLPFAMLHRTKNVRRIVVAIAVVALLGTGSVVRAAPPSPSIAERRAAAPGESFRLTVRGTGLAGDTRLWTSFSEPMPLSKEPVDNGKNDGHCDYDVVIPSDAPLGVHAIRVVSPVGVSLPLPFVVDDLPATTKTPGGQSLKTAQPISLPVGISGRVDNLSRDYYRFHVESGQTVSFEAFARRLGSPLDASLYLYDDRGRILAYCDDAEGLSSDPQFVHTFAKGGDYILELRDIRYQGGDAFSYYLRIGDFPCVHSAFPLAVQRGVSSRIDFAGVSCDDAAPSNITVPADWKADWYPVSTRRPGGRASAFATVIVSDQPEIVDREPNNNRPQAQQIELGPAISGRFNAPDDVDQFRFTAHKGERWLFAGATREIGTPSDLTFRLLNDDGKAIASADDSGVSEGTLDVTFPADGVYILELVDLNRRGGSQYSYRVTPTRHRPGFALSASADTLNVPAGGSTSFTVTAVRRDFNGPIELTMADLPPGVTAGHAWLGTGVNSATMTVSAAKDAPPVVVTPIRVTGSSPVIENGRHVVASLSDAIKARWNSPTQIAPAFTANLGLAVSPPSPFTLTIDPPEVRLGRNLSANVRVVVDRSPGFDAPIKLSSIPEKDGLPPNVTVELKPIDAGKNEVMLNIAASEKAELSPFSIALAGSHEKEKVTTTATAPNLTIRVEDAFQLAAISTSTPQLAKGQSLTFKVKVVRNPAFSGEVKLTCDKLPAGVTATEVVLKPDQMEADLVVTAAADAAAVPTAEVQLKAISAADAKVSSSITLPTFSVN